MVVSNLLAARMLIVILLVNRDYGFLVLIRIQSYPRGHLNLLLMLDLQLRLIKFSYGRPEVLRWELNDTFGFISGQF